MSASSQDTESWIAAFCSLVGHEYFAEVSEDFIEDDFNLTGLQSQVPMYKEALEMILDVEPETSDYSGASDLDDDEDGSLNGSDGEYRAYARQERRQARLASDYGMIESSAELLYGLIHQRFITSRQGIQQMLEKYEHGHFGACPRVHCRGAKVLPVGTSDIPGQDTVKLFCPACLDVYAPPNSRFQTVDGAFFGTTFGCLFFMTFPELDVAGTRGLENGLGSSGHAESSGKAVDADKQATVNGVAAHNLAPGLGKGSLFEPRIYGFRVSELAKTGPRMKWLRMKPEKVSELDEVAIWESRMEYDEGVGGQEGAVEEQGGEGEEGILEGEEEDDEEEEEEEEEDEEEVGGTEAAGAVVDDASGRGKKGRHRGVNGEVR
ncbi:putative casein kinase II regulatory subunit [Elsinoe australis]|uniref:Casein kinase II subunit beta n=1 Tax=Elsinoe australis TaxID=40998 RepID=A0A4U7AZB8_9PEZI|nr:putative casein kinase II regulatory subunit [Elsinoe australis]